jgi:hypothetical protein
MGSGKMRAKGKTPAAPAGAGRSAGLGVAPADLEKLRRAVRSGNVRVAREIIDGYLAAKGFNVWWEGKALVAFPSEAKDVVRALRELFAAAGVDVEIVAWPSGGFGPVKIGLGL